MVTKGSCIVIGICNRRKSTIQGNEEITEKTKIMWEPMLHSVHHPPLVDL